MLRIVLPSRSRPGIRPGADEREGVSKDENQANRGCPAAATHHQAEVAAGQTGPDLPPGIGAGTEHGLNFAGTFSSNRAVLGT